MFGLWLKSVQWNILSVCLAVDGFAEAKNPQVTSLRQTSIWGKWAIVSIREETLNLAYERGPWPSGHWGENHGCWVQDGINCSWRRQWRKWAANPAHSRFVPVWFRALVCESETGAGVAHCVPSVLIHTR